MMMVLLENVRACELGLDNLGRTRRGATPRWREEGECAAKVVKCAGQGRAAGATRELNPFTSFSVK